MKTATLFGLVMFLIAFDLRIVDPENVGWLVGGADTTNVSADRAQEYIGWAFFRDAPWSWPLGRIPNLTEPLGTNLAYYDAIPGVGVAMKVLSPHLSAVFQYSGAWLLVCYLLLGLSAYLVVAQVERDEWIRRASALFVVMSPCAMMRGDHIAHSGHFFIVAALALHVATVKGTVKRPILWGALMSSAALACNAYLGAMTFGIVVAGLLVSGAAVRGCVVTAASLLATAVALGHGGRSYGVGGSHYWAADVLTFFGSMGRSRFLPPLPTWGGQYEGFAFIGAGGVAIFFVVLAKGRLVLWRLMQTPRYKALVAVCVVMFAFALTYDIRIASHWVLALDKAYWPFHPYLTSIFRAAGRFSWPLHYLMMLLLPVAAARVLSKRQAYGVIVVALLLQIVDQWPIWQGHRAGYADALAVNTSTASWRPFLINKSRIAMIPPQLHGFDCDGVVYPENHWIRITVAAANAHLPINTGYEARMSEGVAAKHCKSELSAFRDKRLEGTLYAIDRAWLSRQANPVSEGLECMSHESYELCSTISSSASSPPPG